ncbi:MAG: fasciclin domain-containing protein [Pseudobdellovibrionaceae bacterium]
MKNALLTLLLGLFSISAQATGGQAAVKDDVSQKNIVQIATGSKDHSTLVTALGAADLVDVLANPGPFTVFAPVNEAFAKLPKGTVEKLLKPESKESLVDILQHHVFVGVLEAKDLTDGRVLNQVDGNNVTVKNEKGKISIDGAKVIATIRATNGIIYVVDSVILVKK